MVRRVCLLVLAGLAMAAPVASRSSTVIVSTTTSTQDSGLLDVLVPMFEKKSGMSVKMISVGTGQALALAARGEADVTLAHAPELERRYVAEGKMLNRRLVMYNDFVIIGAWYIESGQGMGQTLGIANDRRAYILSDRGTWLAFQRRVSLPILIEKDTLLLNIYSVMEVNPANGPRVNAAGGKAFADFMLAPETQAVIRTFGVDRYGQPLFVPIAGKSDADFR
ncbi:MAG: tungsten ABC transporter substrate-binding protein [Candidatus Rokuibacteriota bacterium]|nr:MAG: tungsten ABC transporter substrate-binding protein [Candidatus Rokubacteria bacterium]